MPEKLQTRIDRLTLEPPPPNPLLPASNWNALLTASGGHLLAAGVGSRICFSFRPVAYVPMRLRWVARITEFAWYSHFCDEQIIGPFDYFHHRHGIRAEMQQGRIGTQLIDEIDFELPMGTVGQLLGYGRLPPAQAHFRDAQGATAQDARSCRSTRGIRFCGRRTRREQQGPQAICAASAGHHDPSHCRRR
jgi:ligand-binding SRPBCC domain-containing protein